MGARLYAIGGDTGDAHRDVWSAAIEPDGLGDWRDEAPLRRPLAFMGAAALDGAIWLFGGFGRDTALSDRIFRGDVAFDGTLTWSAAGRIPDVRFAPGVAATAEEVWLLGGSDQTFSGSVRTWRAPHDADGLGAWEAGPDLVDGVMAPITAPLANGEVVVAGGFTGGDSVSAAWRLVDGAWEAYGALPTGRFSTYHAIAGGRMHTLGGWTGNFAEVLDDAWSSPLCAETP